ncbi:unnamed protein product [Spirodela intermedia]|uniref:Small acidic protein-like domain-containing protein n=1 Tax=Spirodela intermedia TaxID=51605 RepID=A0A7I8JZU1_SPIIN|nr:unnamed protein product [Spirodela intermedia]
MYGSKTRDERKYYNRNRSANYSRHQRDADEGERNQFRSSRSGRESRRGNIRYESTQRIDKYSRDDYGTDRRSRDKSDSRSHRTEYHRHNDRYLSSDRPPSGGQYDKSYRGDIKNREQDQYQDRAERTEKRDGPRSPGDYEHDRTSLNGRKGHPKDSRVDKDSETGHRKETYSRNIKEVENESIEHKRKHNEREYDKRKDRFDRGEGEERRNDAKYSATMCDRDARDNNTRVVEDSLSKKHKPGHLEKPAAEDAATIRVDVGASPSLSKEKNVADGNSGAAGSSSSQVEVSQDFNAAKVAAMKAAELVNKNLTGCGFLSTAQKKKLLWGNKKNEPPEEGVKGEIKLEAKPDDSLRAEKEKELQMDLEKQYTAGLRRRDGRTVGLGL